MKSILLTLIVFLNMVVPCSSQIFNERFEHWPVDPKIKGQIVVAGELQDVSILAKLLRQLDRSTKTAVVLAPSTDAKKASFKEVFAKNEEIEFPRVPETSDEIETLLSEYDVLIWNSSLPLSKNLAGEILRASDAFNDFIKDGKTLVVIGGVAQVLAQTYFESDDTIPPVMKGLGLLPDCVLKTDFDESADQNRLLAILAAKKHSVGIGLHKHTALTLSGRKFRVVGPGKATFMLKGNDREPVRIQSITAVNRRSRNLEKCCAGSNPVAARCD